jgi:prophage regulatory protein
MDTLNTKQAKGEPPSMSPAFIKNLKQGSMQNQIDLFSIFRLQKVLSLTGKSRASFYQHITDGLWTHPVSIGERSVGWPAYEVMTLNSALIAGKSSEEIRLLVTQLENSRQTLYQSIDPPHVPVTEFNPLRGQLLRDVLGR